MTDDRRPDSPHGGGRFNVPYVSGRELGYLKQVIESRQFAGNGPFTRRAQEFLQERYDVPHVLLTHSCTGAMELSGLLLDLGPNDEVIVPSYTFCATAAAFQRTGAKIVFCEVDPATMNMDVADVKRRITPRTRLVVPVHYAGVGVEMDELLRLADEHGLYVVEDAAQGLDAQLRGQWHGTMAPLGAISFHETKNVHCGLGGALLINDRALFERAEDIWERGTNRAKMFKGLVDKYSWVELGSSFYPSELQAAFLLAQLEALDEITRRRRAVWEAYQASLAAAVARGIISVPRTRAEDRPNYHAFVVIFSSVAECDRVRQELAGGGAQAYIGYVPLHSSPMGQRLGYSANDLPITEEYAARVLRLPLHCDMTAEDAQHVAAALLRSVER